MKPLLLILLLKVLVIALIIAQGTIGLAPDEAQYWTWSQALDWGYYSKPPGIAWQIALTTSLFGNTHLGVRFGALLIGFLLPLAVYAVARGAQLTSRTAFWAAIITAFCPLGVYLSFAATTDGGAILFITLAAVALLKGPHYWVAGLCILCGALFKWTAFVFWPLALIFLLFFKPWRKWSVCGGIVLSLLALLPSLYWNVHHEWATFRHVSKAVSSTHGGNFFDFFASQIALLSPVFFVLLVVSFFFLKRSGNTRLYFIALFPCLALVYFAASFFKKMQPNWAAYLYPVSLPLAAWVGIKRPVWLHIGMWSSIVMVSFLFMIPWLQEKTPLPYALNPFRHELGWEKLAPALTKAGYTPEKNFLFADKYQAASLLSFYAPEQKRAYFFNISGSRKNQFSYWPQMAQKEVGNTGYFVMIENTNEAALSWYQAHYLKTLQPYFSQIDYRGAYPLFSVAGRPVKYALIFACTGYSGALPPETKKY